MSGDSRAALPDDRRLDRRALVAPAELEARTESVWQGLAPRLLSARRARTWGPTWKVVFAGGVVAAAAALLLLLFAPAKPAPQVVARPKPAPTMNVTPIAGTRLHTTGQASRLALPDGSQITAAPGADVELTHAAEDRVAFHVHLGRAEFDVARNPDRRFIVEVGAATVEVIGTQFVVERRLHEDTAEGTRHATVLVGVARGVVEVRHGRDVRTLQAGDSWTIEESLQRTPPVEEGEPASAPSSPQRPRRTHDGPALLFGEAARARLEGRHGEAAALYQDFLAQHPRDARASLVAFELGRTRMDVLADRPGAIAALERSLALAPDSPFRQEALARLVRLREATGDRAGCAKARAQYLQDFPRGRLVEDVTRRCPPR